MNGDDARRMETVLTDGGKSWSGNSAPRQSDWLGYPESSTGTLPTFPKYGMTVGQLAAAQSAISGYARKRIKSVGAEQYSDATHQAFEDMTPSRIIDEAIDEAADLVNYLAFLVIQLQRIQRKIEDEL